MRLILKNFRLVDEENDFCGALIADDGIITALLPEGAFSCDGEGAGVIVDGSCLSSSAVPLVLMPAFVDLHAHFRDPGSSESGPLPAELPFPSEMIESASLSAAAGGFGTVVCMANTKPPIDSIEKAAALKNRSDALGLIDLYPVLSLTKNMEGRELSDIFLLLNNDNRNNGGLKNDGIPPGAYVPLMLSEDGKDLADDGLFLAAMKEAKRIGVPVSCHCDLGGDENNAVRRVIELGKKAGCHIHIAHVSTAAALETIRLAKPVIPAGKFPCATAAPAAEAGFTLSCEAMPHHLCLTEKDAIALGEKTWGRVNPPLRPEEDRQALIQAVADGTVDAIATDHAPHSGADKEAGAPGFSGFETAFAALYTELVRGGAVVDLKRLSSLMSAGPARLLGFGQKRGRMLPGFRADLVIVDTETPWTVDTEAFKSRGKNSPFIGREFYGKILMTLHSGNIVYNKR